MSNKTKLPNSGIAVLGAGAWGTALALVLCRKHPTQRVCLWGHDAEHLQQLQEQGENLRYLPGIALPNNLYYEPSLEQVVRQHHDLLIVIPSRHFMALITQMLAWLTPQHRLAWGTKGLAANGIFLHQALQATLPWHNPALAVISGPSFAMEVARQLPTAVVLASTDQQFATDLMQYLHGQYFRLYQNRDFLGVEFGGIAKNILALAAGIVDGMRLGSNARAAILTRGLREAGQFAAALGFQQETLFGLAGLGDLILSATDNQSRNRCFGLALGQMSERCAEVDVSTGPEVLHNLRLVCSLGLEHNLQLPLLSHINKVLNGDMSPRAALESLLLRAPETE
jgi:glycerol-3-phosphate dehydrogenase (NAD(P)+)